MPEISVIVPVYKVEKYLENCVKSILRQSYSDFELILVDDGSPDSCGEICDRLANMDSRIKVIHKENGGLSSARNVGINVACGKYITFVDSDDFIMPQYIEKLYSVIEDGTCLISTCDFIRCNENDDLTSVEEQNNEREDIRTFSNEAMMYSFFTEKYIGTTAWAKLYNISLFKSIKYPERKYNEDTFTTYKVLHSAKSIRYVGYLGYIYRINSTSIMNEKYSPRKLDSIEGSLERALFIQKEYPSLSRYGNRSVVEACNNVILSMARSKVFEKNVLNALQEYYRKYAFDYVFTKTSFFGKIFTLLAFVNVEFAYKLYSIYYKDKEEKNESC